MDKDKILDALKNNQPPKIRIRPGGKTIRESTTRNTHERVCQLLGENGIAIGHLQLNLLQLRDGDFARVQIYFFNGRTFDTGLEPLAHNVEAAQVDDLLKQAFEKAGLEFIEEQAVQK